MCGIVIFVRRVLPCLFLTVLVGCGGGGGGGDSDSGPNALDNELRQLTRTDLGMTGDPLSGTRLAQIRPDDDDLVKLGQLLFFSKTLSGGFDVACASCHHPDFAGGDGLSLPVGVNAVEPSKLGPGRRLDPFEEDLDPLADGGPNVPRNSQTVFNTALYRRAMFHDGRVFVLDEAVVPGGEGQDIRTPEGGNTPDTTAGDNLLQAQAKLPMPSNSEMRDFLYTNYATAVEYRSHLVRRLRGQEDQACCFTAPDAATASDNWLALFRNAFEDPDGTQDELITQARIQEALAVYEASMIFVDTPWKRYLAGHYGALSERAKRGAELFLNDPDDPRTPGLGCVGCHSGDRFTDEGFHNVGFPQIGRGKRIGGEDLGRWLVTSRDEHRHVFRTPSLLNVAETAPYGHAGTFATLREVLEYHSDPAGQVDLFDFTLQHLDQFRGSDIVYPDAETHTRAAIAAASFAGDRLPGRALTDTELDRLVAFLENLTDACVADPACIDDWTPAIEEDPDGHLLVRDGQDTFESVDAPTPGDYPSFITLDYPTLEPRTTFSDVTGCSDKLDALNAGTATFTRLDGDPDFGLRHPHGFSQETWFHADGTQIDPVMVAGGVSAVYLDDDCYPDLIYAGGDTSGMKLYRNLTGDGGDGFGDITGALLEDPGTRFTGAAVVDLNGDYRRELLFANLHDGEVPIYSSIGDSGEFTKIAALPMARHSFGISFAPLDDNSYPYLYLSHWSNNTGTVRTSPALWKNENGTTLRPWDAEAKTTSANVDQRFNFTPRFADFTGDGNLDLVIASDFDTSVALQYRPDGPGDFVYDNVTDPDVITDQNGMGATILDLNNDGKLEWFVTSIYAEEDSNASWGKTGNRLYENTSSGGDMTFADITDDSGVRDGNWGWGACAADFDNDGFIDIFHVNGFGNVPEEVDKNGARQEYQELYKGLFLDIPPRLFMNDGDGTFTERAAAWNIDVPSDGRGVVCFDYDRDGDLDIVLLDHSTGLQFFENDIGHGAGRHFLSIRLVGTAPNTDAIGAKVHVTANVGNGHGEQTMLRLSEASSNFDSQNPPDLHFGLGSASMADVRVVWPGGEQLVCADVAANQFLVLDERDGGLACTAP